MLELVDQRKLGREIEFPLHMNQTEGTKYNKVGIKFRAQRKVGRKALGRDMKAPDPPISSRERKTFSAIHSALTVDRFELNSIVTGTDFPLLNKYLFRLNTGRIIQHNIE